MASRHQRKLKVGDKIRVIGYRPGKYPPGVVDEMGTEELFKSLVGRRYTVRGLDDYGNIELRPKPLHTVWIEPDLVEFRGINQSMNRMNPKVNFFFNKADKWQKEFEKLRTIVLGCGLTEELRWGKPCYTFEKSNVVLIHGFKEYCALLFFKGALLKDAKGILVQQTENVQAARQIRFSNVREIVKMEPILKAYIKEAIEVEKAGLQVDYKKTTEFKIPEEFQNKLDKIPALKTAFAALTPGRQRGYILYFSGAKQPKTREARVEKCMPQILKGKGLDD